VGHYNTILQQLLTHIPRHQFQTLVDRHQADRYAKTFTTWNQLTVLLYAQASGQQSLRDIEQSLDTQRSKTYHIGLPEHVGRSTLSDANGRRDWEIFQGLFGKLVERCRSVTPKHKFRFKSPLYSVDSTTISLCLSMFPDKETDRDFDFVTNNTTLAATTIAAIYKARWQIEAFFKWIKQNLKIKSFLGTTENAVLTQIWVAMIYYLLLAYIKYQTKYKASLFYLHRLVRETLLDRITLVDLLNLNERRLRRLRTLDPQLHFGFLSP
jgi:hypothetical protein